MNRAVVANTIGPVIDKVCGFDKAQANHLATKRHLQTDRFQ
jgi:hypothetical protein